MIWHGLEFHKDPDQSTGVHPDIARRPSIAWRILILSYSNLQFVLSGRIRPPAVSIAPILLPQHAPLTTVDAQPICAGGLTLPEPVHTAIVECGASALRAWRNYRELSMLTLQKRTHLRTATLTALDHGEVLLCEWTVGALAKALRVEPWQLISAQALASAYQPSSDIPNGLVDLDRDNAEQIARTYP